MKPQKQRRIILLILVLIISCLQFQAFAHGTELNMLLNGEMTDSATFIFSSPFYLNLSQFGEERLEYLNRLLSHISVAVSMEGTVSKTSISVDREEVCSFTVEQDNGISRTAYSFEPDTVFESKEHSNEKNSDFSGFLNGQFFLINRLMDDLYPLFEKTAEVFKDKSKTEKTNLNYSGFGKGVRRTTIQFSADFVSNFFPKVLSDIAPTEESRNFTDGLLFSGAQRIILLYDQNDHLLRINYDGITGFSAESMRKVSIIWRCLRTEEQKKDSLTMKSPSIEGADRYNFSFTRDLNLTEPEHHYLSWEFQLDLKSGEEKTKLQYNADLTVSENELTGKILYSRKQNNIEHNLSFIPQIKKENTSDYSGTLEITNKTGKIINSSIKCGICIFPCNGLDAPETKGPDIISTQDRNGKSAEELLQLSFTRLLIRRLMTLPASDIIFLSSDISDEEWHSLMQLLK